MGFTPKRITALLLLLAMLSRSSLAKLILAQPACRATCVQGDVMCLNRCLTGNKPSGGSQRIRRSGPFGTDGVIDFSKIVIIGANETPPPGLIKPTGDRPRFPGIRQRSCRGADPRDSNVFYPGKVQNVQTECEPATAFSPQRVVVKWSPPEKSQTHLVKGYEIAYHVKVDHLIDPTSLSCLYANNETRSQSFDMTIKSNEHLYISVIALPTYENLSSTMVLVSCLENATEKPQPSVESETEPSRPLDIAVMIGGVVGAICFLMFLFVIAKILTSSSVSLPCGGAKQSSVGNKHVDVGVEETGYKRQLTGDTTLRDSMLSFRSQTSLAAKVYEDDSIKTEAEARPKVYISYYPDSDNFKASLLALVARLRTTHGIDVIFDELDKRSIDKLGSAAWCNENLKRCDKVMLVITPKYLEALQDIDTKRGDNPVLIDLNYKRKICVEAHYVNTRLFAKNQRCSDLVLLLAGTEESQLPVEWSGRAVYDWPTANEDSERRLICCLNDVEDFIV